MRLVKMLGLAMVAALASMAFIGASSAYAKETLICHLEAGAGSGGCPEGQLPYNGKLLAHSEVDTFASGFVRVECLGHQEGTINSNGLGEIKVVTWSNCKNNVGCSTTTAKAEALPWTVHVLGAELNVGHAVMHVLNPKGSFSISGGIFCPTATCIYSAENALVEVLDSLSSSEPNTIHAKEVELTKLTGSSSACSATGKWSALYKVSEPTDLHIHLLP